ncbi:MAG TPA: flavin reductase family protein [Acidimicrobiales bacterium]|nr:flavin reductase family protein [Acidimicrobiales bacterium]
MVDVEVFKAALGSFATGVAVVAAVDAAGPVGFTCQSVVSLSLEPPLVALAPSKASTSWPRIAGAGSFCINVLSESQEELGRRFAVTGGDKFAGVAWTPAPSGAPRLEGVLAWVDCRLELVHDAGDHEIVLGRVLDLGVDDDGGGPLLFYRAEFRRLDPAPGTPTLRG